MNRSRNESGISPERIPNESGLTRTRACARRGALETGDRSNCFWRNVSIHRQGSNRVRVAAMVGGLAAILRGRR